MPSSRIQPGIKFEHELIYKLTEITKRKKRSLNARVEYLAALCVNESEEV